MQTLSIIGKGCSFYIGVNVSYFTLRLVLSFYIGLEIGFSPVKAYDLTINGFCGIIQIIILYMVGNGDL